MSQEDHVTQTTLSLDTLLTSLFIRSVAQQRVMCLSDHWTCVWDNEVLMIRLIHHQEGPTGTTLVPAGQIPILADYLSFVPTRSVGLAWSKHPEVDVDSVPGVETTSQLYWGPVGKWTLQSGEKHLTMGELPYQRIPLTQDLCHLLYYFRPLWWEYSHFHIRWENEKKQWLEVPVPNPMFVKEKAQRMRFDGYYIHKIIQDLLQQGQQRPEMWDSSRYQVELGFCPRDTPLRWSVRSLVAPFEQVIWDVAPFYSS